MTLVSSWSTTVSVSDSGPAQVACVRHADRAAECRPVGRGQARPPPLDRQLPDGELESARCAQVWLAAALEMTQQVPLLAVRPEALRRIAALACRAAGEGLAVISAVTGDERIMQVATCTAGLS